MLRRARIDVEQFKRISLNRKKGGEERGEKREF
jgi:hypothetical protein